jgi:guanylate kinase
MTGRLFVISAPSGTGKSTIIRGVRQGLDRLGYSVSHTSRPPRGNEREGMDYYFVDRLGFERMIAQETLVEWAEVYGAYYGTSALELERLIREGLDVLLDIDSQGARNIRTRFPDTVLIYLLPPSLEALEARLKGRGTDTPQTIMGRMEKSYREMANCVWYDYIVINDDLDQAVRAVRSVIVAERCRTGPMGEIVSKIYPSLLKGQAHGNPGRPTLPLGTLKKIHEK